MWSSLVPVVSFVMSHVYDDAPLVLNAESEFESYEGEGEGEERGKERKLMSRDESLRLAVDLRKLMLRVEGTSDGGEVDYESLAKSDDFAEYKKKAARLRECDVFAFTETERKVFFLNLYNSLTLHALIHHNTPSSVLSVPGFWRNSHYAIGHHTYSLDVIEHAILRANSPHPTTGIRYFEDGDPRMKLALSSVDPRIHFALNCGAISCPPIRCYTVENVEEALNKAAISFCSTEVEVKTDRFGEPVIHMSKIFQWYGKDFGENENQMLGRILKYLPEPTLTTISDLISKSEARREGEGGRGEVVRVIYKDYDWSLNNGSGGKL